MPQKMPQPARNRDTAQKRSNYRHREATANPMLVRLIEQDAPLLSHSHLVLMYGFFQAEMAPEANQGVASWIKDCIRQYGLPSLVRFDSHRRAQIFRRDQFQPWIEPLMKQAC
ncbi:MAG TPA: hypothetical protein VL134_11630 [Leptolyngbya sp.]|jgi:hypothetical protein|nr:hypothetical protein [Leptolyngbya sp.]